MESRFISKTIRKIIEAFCYIVWGFGLLRTDFVPGVIPGGGNKRGWKIVSALLGHHVITIV